MWSAIGREFTIATNQVHFAVPAKFDLTYRDRDNTDKTPLGAHERFIGFLIEHYAGNVSRLHTGGLPRHEAHGASRGEHRAEHQRTPRLNP